jgi:hypothetical protein
MCVGIQSTLLRDIAIIGGGMYAFIPDSGFVGTAFVNALANQLATMGTHVCDLFLFFVTNNHNLMTL